MAPLRIETAQFRLDMVLRGLRCTWSHRVDDAWQVMATDRPTQAYDFGWWDGAVPHYLACKPGERFYAPGERSGPMDRSGRRLRLTNLDATGYDAETGDPLDKHMYWDEVGGALNFTNPDTAAWWREQVTAALLRCGIAATWNDNNEYEVWDCRALIVGFGSPRPATDARSSSRC